MKRTRRGFGPPDARPEDYLPPMEYPSDARGRQMERSSFSLPVTRTARERVDPAAERVVVTIRGVATRAKGYIFGQTTGEGDLREVFLHGSAFDQDLFEALQPGDSITCVLTLGPKGFKGLAGRRWTGNE